MSFSSAFLTLPYHVPRRLIIPQPDKLRMSQVTIRVPFGELDLGDHLSSRTESTDNDNSASGLLRCQAQAIRLHLGRLSAPGQAIRNSLRFNPASSKIVV